VSLWERVLDNLTFSYFGLNSSSVRDTFLIAIIVTSSFLLSYWLFAKVDDPILPALLNEVNAIEDIEKIESGH
jgi:hypothetical protein